MARSQKEGTVKEANWELCIFWWSIHNCGVYLLRNICFVAVYNIMFCSFSV